MRFSKVREEVLPHAVRSGDRAYQFVATRKGLVEVRVWPDGRTHYTRVDSSGKPVAKPRKGLVRAGGWRAQQFPRLTPLHGLAVVVAGLIAERLV